MPDREKVIKDLEEYRDRKFVKEGTTVFDNDPRYRKLIIGNALAFLKEQEAVTIKKTKEHGFGVYGGICPKCRNWIQSAHSFCGFCGQAVKWE